MYTDNDYKFIAVLNKKIELPKLLNALGHISVGLTSLIENIDDFRFLQYYDADGGLHPAISHYPFIILSAKNGNQIRQLREKAIESGIIYNDFVDQMLGASAEDQLNQTKNTKNADFEYFAICLFGSYETLRPLTKKFSVFK